jgi:hypothetical protein
MTALDLITQPRLARMWGSWGGTVGDLALPVLFYGLVRGAALLPPASRGGPGKPGEPGNEPGEAATLPPTRRRPIAFVAALGAAGGAAAQAGWLADPDPRPNWLLVAPHTLSGPGWYHLGFLVVAAAGVAGLAYRFLDRARRGLAERVRALLGTPGAYATLTAAALFAGAVVLDAVPSIATVASRATAAAVLGAVVALLALAAARLGRTAGALLAPAGVAVALGTAFVGAVELSRHLNWS